MSEMQTSRGRDYELLSHSHCCDAPSSPGGQSMFHNNSPHPHRYSNEDFIVIISCCSVPRCHRDMLCADPLSAVELSSLMNLSGVSDSGWENVVYKTGRSLVWVLRRRADTLGVDVSSTAKQARLLLVGSCRRYQGHFTTR